MLIIFYNYAFFPAIMFMYKSVIILGARNLPSSKLGLEELVDRL